MTLYIDLDSAFRDRFTYPNPADYQIGGNDTDAWFSTSRMIATCGGCPFRARIVSLTLPFTLSVEQEPRLYVELQPTDQNSLHRLMTIDGRHATDHFIMTCTHTQRDSTGQPLWLHYQCITDHDAKIRKGSTFNFRVRRRDESIVTEYIDVAPEGPINMNNQTMVTMAISPLDH